MVHPISKSFDYAVYHVYSGCQAFSNGIPANLFVLWNLVFTMEH